MQIALHKQTQFADYVECMFMRWNWHRWDGWVLSLLYVGSTFCKIHVDRDPVCGDLALL